MADRVDPRAVCSCAGSLFALLPEVFARGLEYFSGQDLPAYTQQLRYSVRERMYTDLLMYVVLRRST